MGKRNGNRYSEEFKQGAIKLVLENKQSIAEVCRNLGVIFFCNLPDRNVALIACFSTKPKCCVGGYPTVLQKASGCIGDRKVPTRGSNGKSADRNRLFPISVVWVHCIIAFWVVRIHSEKYVKNEETQSAQGELSFLFYPFSWI